MEELENETDEIRIKKMLRKFTENFSSVDIQFIMDLEYPTTVKVEDLDVALNPDIDGMYIYTIDNLYDLEDIFKRLPVNCKVVIPTLVGKMTLMSREDK